MNNINIINIFNNKIKPDISKYNIDELIWIITNYNILYNKESNSEELEKLNKTDLINIIYNLWNIQPIENDIECSFCLNVITNGDNLMTNCEHMYHSTCFFNYLFNSCKSKLTDINNTNNISNYFRCPKCRNYLSNQINDTDIETNNNQENNLINNQIIINGNYFNNNYYTTNFHNNNNINIDLITGLWIPSNNINLDLPNLSGINIASDSDTESSIVSESESESESDLEVNHNIES